MALTLLFAAFHIFVVTLPPIAVDVPLTFAVTASLLGLLSMVSICVEMGASIVDIMRNQSRDFLQEVDWDLSQAATLDSLDKHDLMRALEFLELKTSRVHERIKLFIGGPDKIVMGQQRVDGMSQKVVELCLTEELISPDSDGEYELPEAA